MSIFAETLTSLRNRHRLSVQELAEAAGISPSHIMRLETDYVTPDEAMLARLAAIFNVTPYYLIGATSREMEISEPGGGMPLQKYLSVPVLSARQAASLVIQESAILEHIILPLPKDRETDYVGIKIDYEDVDCPRMQKGDIAVVQITTRIQESDLVAVSHGGGGAFFRYYSRQGPSIILSSYKGNPLITYKADDTEYKILGKVVKFEGRL